MNPKLPPLPDDIAALKRIIHEQRQQIDMLLERIKTLEHRLYGHRSESGPVVKADKAAPQKGRHSHGRRRLPDDLPRQHQQHDLPAKDRVCQECGGFLSKIGEIVSEQLDMVPPALHVVTHHRSKYACKHCQGSVVVAAQPLQPIDKGLAGSGLLADVLISKYEDHLPLYRQQQRFERFGFKLSCSTLSNWALECGHLLAPLVERMVEKNLLVSGHAFTDDTPIRVLQRSEGQGKHGRFWIYANKGSERGQACCVYRFSPGRHRCSPFEFLKNFKGYLQADAYPGYNQLYQTQKIVEIACWSHARRKFYESVLGCEVGSLAHKALQYIRILYRIERLAQVRNLNDDQMKAWRHRRSQPILDAFYSWLKNHQSQVLPKSLLGQAINYALNHWQALTNYLNEGYLEIDNNRSENALRPLVIGRKNYLFVGNNKAGNAAAVIYSLIETCKKHHVNRWHYFKDVLQRLSTHPQSRIDELLPYNWQPLQQNINPPNQQHAA